MKHFAYFISVISLLSGCQFIDELTQDTTKIAKEKESFAIGAACRQSNKGIEDCFNDHEKIIKSKVLEGWKDMDIYIRENPPPTPPVALPIPTPQPNVPNVPQSTNPGSNPQKK